MGVSHSKKYQCTDVKSSASEVNDFQSSVYSDTAPGNFMDELDNMNTFEGALQDFVIQFLKMKDENDRYRTKYESNTLLCFRRKTNKRSHDSDSPDRIHDLQKMFKGLQQHVSELVESLQHSKSRLLSMKDEQESKVQQYELQEKRLREQCQLEKERKEAQLCDEMVDLKLNLQIRDTVKNEVEQNNLELLSAIDLLKQELEKTKNELDKSRDRERQVSDEKIQHKLAIEELSEATVALETFHKHNFSEEEYKWKLSELEDQLSEYKKYQRVVVTLRDENRKLKEVYAKFKTQRKNTLQHYSGLFGELRKTAPNNYMLEETHTMLTKSLKKYDRKAFK
uniref:A-kinase anchor protein 9-like n=1 Tax=Saccoglossus kowalevskii TaxID=10224 RepID=A0ABM0LV04_SACKO|nr:PREDICTED: A-kinase anchor protein 9-like [Saccoglossus kowalevskii]